MSFASTFPPAAPREGGLLSQSSLKTLLEKLAVVVGHWNSGNPRPKMNVVQPRSRRVNTFQQRRPWTATVDPESGNALFKIGDGVVRECRISDLRYELGIFADEPGADQIVGAETFDEMKSLAEIADKTCKKMGISTVIYRSLLADIEGVSPLTVEERLYERYPVDDKTMQVFRVRDGRTKYAYVVLMGKTALIQTGTTDMVNAMMNSAYTRGDRNCPVCQEEKRDVIVGFACVMHSVCRDCYVKIVMTKNVCPLCRRPPLREQRHPYLPPSLEL